MQKIWTFVKDANSKPDFKDVLEGVVCLVSLRGEREILLRVRRGDKSYSTDLDGHPLQSVGEATNYTFLGYYGTPPGEPLPTCLSEAKPYQLYKLSNYKWLYWKDESRCVWSLDSTGRIMQETEGATSTVLAVRIDSLSDLTAIPTEV